MELATHIPPEAVKAYKVHRSNAKQRGIDFQFSLQEWWDWWLIDSRWETRGVGAGRLVMARFGDTGPYAIDNVYCTTHEQNLKDIDPARRVEAMVARHAQRKLEGIPHHLEVRGDQHPKSKAIITPIGRFGSAALAAEAYGITRQRAAQKARWKQDSWRYESDEPITNSPE